MKITPYEKDRTEIALARVEKYVRQEELGMYSKFIDLSIKNESRPVNTAFEFTSFSEVHKSLPVKSDSRICLNT
ncbi:MAG: hypothetical protein J0L82_18825 [Deltaproteobacteria bacterium]|jgi:hypothetical protein|nr:hypothetical protein [Deltaproteobacteria bacterium]